MAKTKTPSGLSMKHKIGYACGDLGGCMTFALMGSIVTRYYTNVLQVNTVVLATMLLVWNVWDAVNDPLMGALMDKVFAKHHGQGGKFRPWLLDVYKRQLPASSAGSQVELLMYRSKIFL